jgi:histidine triad (HIT) family protein
MYNHAPDDYVCPFCLIAQATEDARIYTVESDVIYRGETVTAFIGSHQWIDNPGNVIVIPNAHHENLYDLPAHYAEPIHRAVQAVALALKAAYGCDGVSTRQHNEPAGDQDVWHYHVHVTPRYANDTFYAVLATKRELMPVETRAAHAAKVRAHLQL